MLCLCFCAIKSFDVAFCVSDKHMKPEEYLLNSSGSDYRMTKRTGLAVLCFINTGAEVSQWILAIVTERINQKLTACATDVLGWRSIYSEYKEMLRLACRNVRCRDFRDR